MTRMSESVEKSDYLLLFRGNEWEKKLPPEELKKVVTDWYAWFQRLATEGKCLGGLPLLDSGKLISGKNGRTVADGPFAESKESIIGYWIVDVDSEARAIEIASRVVAFIGPAGAPPVEVRQIMDAPPEV